MIRQVIKSYFQSQLEELKLSESLLTYGFFLILVHFLTALFWHWQNFTDILTNIHLSYCWPFLKNCENLKRTLLPIASFLLPAYAITSVLAVICFRKNARYIWCTLFILEIFKIFLQFLDYRFMGNYHFMPHIITLIYLFAPAKNPWIRLWIVTFYLSAASLKINLEWLSGASLSMKMPFDDPRILTVGTYLGLMTEIIAPQLLYFSAKSYRKFALLLLACFHGASAYWVGYFYPTVMFSLLSIFYFDLSKTDNSELWFHKSAFRKIQFLPVFCLWSTFVFLQISNLVFYREAALGLRSRLFTLNMFDARPQCKGTFLIYEKNSVAEVNFANQELSARVQCDPIIFFEQGRHLCEARLPHPPKIEAYLYSRLLSDAFPEEIIRKENLCEKYL